MIDLNLFTISAMPGVKLWHFLFLPNGTLSLTLAQTQTTTPWDDIIFVAIAGFVVALLIVGIFVFKSVWRQIVTRKVKSINVYGMTPGDADKMKKTGLLTDEEFARIKERQIAVAREKIERERQQRAEESMQRDKRKKDVSKILDGMDPDLAAAVMKEGVPISPQLASRSLDDQLREQIIAQGGEIEEQQPPPNAPQAATAFYGKSKKPAQKAFDIDDMFERGLITLEEYEQMKSKQE